MVWLALLGKSEGDAESEACPAGIIGEGSYTGVAKSRPTVETQSLCSYSY